MDPYGLTLTTNRKAATAYNRALGRLLCLQDGVESGLEAAVAADPGFAQAHAALALLGHEWGAVGSWRQALQAAHAAAADRHLDDREVSFLDAVTTRLRSDEETGAAALLRHIRLFPRDALAVSVAVPTVAFGGLTSGRQTAQLVEGLGRTYGDDWWYAGQLAFVRQDQERWGEAEELASYALSVEPSSGHAVHARAHVYYETGQHTEGLAWLDGWISSRGPEANHRSHFSWHAALHELMQCDVDAVRRRYERELAPPLVTGSRALVDSGALLWRCHVTGTWEGALPSAGGLRLGPRRVAAQPTHRVRRHALGPGSGHRGRRGRPRGAAHHRARPPRPGVPRRGRAAVRGAPAGRRGRVRRGGRPAHHPAPPHRLCSAAAPPSVRCWRTRWCTRWPARARASAPPRCSTSGSAAGRPRSTPVAGRP